MAVSAQSNGGNNRRQNHRGRADIKTIKIGEREDKEQEVTVRYESVPRRKDKSTLSWFEEFTIEWSETLILKKHKKIRKKGE
jgi:hypothetical protein